MVLIGIEKTEEKIMIKGIEYDTLYIYDDKSERLPEKGISEHTYPVLDENNKIIAYNCYPFIPRVVREDTFVRKIGD